MSENTYTIAKLVAREGKLDQLQTILSHLAVQTRQEAGAIEYFFIQDQARSNTILSFEKWATAEDEAAHWQTPHLLSAIEQMTPILDEAPVVHKGERII